MKDGGTPCKGCAAAFFVRSASVPAALFDAAAGTAVFWSFGPGGAACRSVGLRSFRFLPLSSAFFPFLPLSSPLRPSLPPPGQSISEAAIRSASVRGRSTRQGFPAAMTRGGMSRETTLPAPITAPSPIVTPRRMTALPPIQTLS